MEINTLKTYPEQGNVAPPPKHKIILFELDFNVKFPLLALLQFLSDLKRMFETKNKKIYRIY